MKRGTILFVFLLSWLAFAGVSFASPHHDHHNPFHSEIKHTGHACPLNHLHAGKLCPHLNKRGDRLGVEIAIDCGGDPFSSVLKKETSRWFHLPHWTPSSVATSSELISIAIITWNSIFPSQVEHPPKTVTLSI